MFFNGAQKIYLGNSEVSKIFLQNRDILGLILPTPEPPPPINLITFGSNDFLIENSVTALSYSQSATTLTINGSFNATDTLGGVYISSKMWSGYNSFGLKISCPSTNPNAGFTVDFFDSSFNIVYTYTGNTDTATSAPTIVPLTVSSGSGPLSNIYGIQITWLEPGANNVVFHDVVGYTA